MDLITLNIYYFKLHYPWIKIQDGNNYYVREATKIRTNNYYKDRIIITMTNQLFKYKIIEDVRCYRCPTHFVKTRLSQNVRPQLEFYFFSPFVNRFSFASFIKLCKYKLNC